MCVKDFFRKKARVKKLTYDNFNQSSESTDCVICPVSDMPTKNMALLLQKKVITVAASVLKQKMLEAKVLVLIICISLPSCLSTTCDKICPQNEVFSMKVSQCQNTCWNRNFNETSKCKISPGCVCKHGYLRHPDFYQCIAIESCPKQTNHAQCPKNEIYTICTGNSIECEHTCENRNAVTKKCPCKSKCMCKKGFVRNSLNHQCILASSCEKCPIGFTYDSEYKGCSYNCSLSCPVNQTFTQCGSSCREPKCPLSSKNESSIICTEECIVGCFCQNGYRRDLLTNKCVLSHDCSPIQNCPEYETFKCGNPLCEKTCSTIDEKCTKFPIRCEEKCYCNDGYVRGLEGSQCVSERQCPIINRDV
ncbi:hypothetical protein PVAND_002554 [Polypedilum vanderplanki]|uniref:TIL domain-containing protein n=1 Tax=Polypedilum vanderplanki TaxID=319348 RepID=A0A9J6BRC8_POLVA|nr:hypothetical protein PVAND_002554 [Polypedilum vanderplanki]